MNTHIISGRRGAAAAVLISLAVPVGLATGCASAPRDKPLRTTRAETGAGTVTSARKFLEGRWTLESFEMHPPGKAKLALKGTGTLLYDDFGNLEMEVRADPESTVLLRSAGIDIPDGVISTKGRTVIDQQHQTLTYVLERQDDAVEGPLNMRHPRHWVVEGDVLILTTRDAAAQPLSVSRWRRMP